jgi:NADH-quinone oxidoreductase subunit A
MDAFLLEYLPIVIFLGISSAIGIAFILASAILAP